MTRFLPIVFLLLGLLSLGRAEVRFSEAAECNLVGGDTLLASSEDPAFDVNLSQYARYVIKEQEFGHDFGSLTFEQKDEELRRFIFEKLLLLEAQEQAVDQYPEYLAGLKEVQDEMYLTAFIDRLLGDDGGEKVSPFWEARNRLLAEAGVQVVEELIPEVVELFIENTEKDAVVLRGETEIVRGRRMIDFIVPDELSGKILFTYGENGRVTVGRFFERFANAGFYEKGHRLVGPNSIKRYIHALIEDDVFIRESRKQLVDDEEMALKLKGSEERILVDYYLGQLVKDQVSPLIEDEANVETYFLMNYEEFKPKEGSYSDPLDLYRERKDFYKNRFAQVKEDEFLDSLYRSYFEKSSVEVFKEQIPDRFEKEVADCILSLP